MTDIETLAELVRDRVIFDEKQPLTPVRVADALRKTHPSSDETVLLVYDLLVRQDSGGERPGGLDLVMQLVTHSMDANFRTMDTLYEHEREHRMALEVLLDIFLEHADAAYMGTVREYEEAINILRFKGKSGPHVDLDFHGGNWIQVLSKQHSEYREES